MKSDESLQIKIKLDALLNTNRCDVAASAHTESCFSFCGIKPLKQTHCGSETTKFECLQPIHLKADLNVPPMCFLSEGLLNWHIPEYTNPRGCNKPKLQSWHCCTHNSYVACSEWSSNSHLGICSASQSMNGTCICGESSPLQGLCSTWVWTWMSRPWHLSMAVDF